MICNSHRDDHTQSPAYPALIPSMFGMSHFIASPLAVALHVAVPLLHFSPIVSVPAKKYPA